MDKLERSNTELERRQKILDNLKSSQLETAKNSMVDYLNNKTSKDYSYKIYNPTTWKGYKNQMIVSSNEDLNYEYQDIEATPLEGIESHLNAIKELQDEITQLEQEQTGLSDENDIQKLQKQINSKKSLMEDYKTFVSDNLGKISDETETFDASYFDSDNYNQIQDILNQWDEVLGTTGSRIESKLNGIFEIEALKNTDIKQTLVEYVKPLKDISKFNLDNINVDGIIKLKTALSNANISAEDLYNYLKAIADDGVYDLEEVAKQLKESTTKAILDSDSKADKKITEWTVDNWVNSLSDEELNISAKIKADPEIDTSQWDMETWERQIQNKLNEGIKNITIDSVTKDFSESVDNIQSAYSTLSNAVSEYNKYGAYSLDTLQSLLSLEPQYLAMLVNENGQLGINRTALIDLINTQVEEAKSKLYQAEINEINSLSVSNESGTIDDNTQKYKDNTDAINNNTTAKALNDAISSAKNRGVSQEDIDAIQNKYKTYFDNLNNLQNNIKNNTADILKGFDNSGKSASDAADKIKDIQRQIDDLAKSEALDKLKYKFDSLEQSITKIDNKISLLNDISDLTSEDDYIGKSEIVTQQLELTKSKTNLLVDEFKKLQNEEYNSADSASELASRMKSVADSINENQKQIVEYGKNVSSCYMSALTSISSLSKDSISRATTLIDRNIKSLSEGSLTGLQFNITPTIPQSAVEKQRKENTTLLNDMSSYYDSVAEMQKIALDLQYQEQMDDNARKKEELIKSLNEQKQALNDYFVDIEDTQKAHNNTTTQEMSTDLTNKTIQVQTFTDTVKDTINELLN